MSKRETDKPADDFGAFRPAEERRATDRDTTPPIYGALRAPPAAPTVPPRTVATSLSIPSSQPTPRPAPVPLPPIPDVTPLTAPPAPRSADDFITPPAPSEARLQSPTLHPVQRPRPPAQQDESLTEPLPRVARTGPARSSKGHQAGLPVAPPPPRAMAPASLAVGARPRPPRQSHPGYDQSDYDQDTDEPGRSWGKIVGLSLLGLVGIAGAAAAALVIYTPVDLVRDRLIQEVKAKTGRTLAIGGKPVVTFWPHVGVSLADVSMSNPPGMAGPPLVTMQRLDATIQLWPLLQRRVQVDQLVLQSPRIVLMVDGTGRRNWDFAALDEVSPRRIQVAQVGQTDVDVLPEELRAFAKGASRNRAAGTATADGISLGRVRVVDGALVHHDERTGLAEEARAIDLTIDAPDMSGPLQAAGTLLWRGETVRLDTRIMPARAVFNGTPSQATAAIGAASLQATYAGTFQPGAGANKIDGNVTLKAPSLAKAAQWLGRPIVGEPANGPMTFKGRVSSAGQKFSVGDGALQLPGLGLTGALSIDAGVVRPKLTGQVRLTELNLEQLATLRVLEATARPPAAPPRAVIPRTVAPSAAPAAPPGTTPRSIEDLLKSDAPPAPQVRGFLGRDGWSEQPLDLSALTLLDADLKVAFNKLGPGVGGAGPGHTSIALNDRVLKISLDDVALHDGKVRGTISLDGAAQRPSASINLVADGVALQPLLKAYDAEVIDGKARVTLALTTAGRTERQLIDGLAGKAELLVPRGAFLGLDLSQAVAGLPRGQMPKFERTAGARTDFTDLGATFNITRGVADNRDFRVVTRDVRAIGNGQIALGARTIDAVVRPKLTAAVQSPAGAGGPGINLSGIDLPIRITGPLDKPQVSADFANVLRNPGEVVETLKQLDRNGEVQDTVKGVLAGDEAAKKKARDFLNNLIKR